MRAGDGSSPAEGNADVVALLERLLKEARQGFMRYIAVVHCDSAAQMGAEYTGSIGMEFAVNYGLDALKSRIVNTVQRRELPDGPIQTANYACYNLNKSPCNWDFLIWLVDREMTRRRENAEAPLRVGFYVADVGDYRSVDSQNFMTHVMRPLLPLIGAVEDERAKQGRVNEFFAPRYICQAVRNGEPVPILEASAKARNAVDAFLRSNKVTSPVTITLREASHGRWRNSNLDAWRQFAEWLNLRGEQIVVVRDTARADEKIKGVLICPEASKDVDYRMALYEMAKANLFVSNGPQGLAMFSTVPFLSFHQLNEEDMYQANRPSWWKENNGIAQGEQYPWFDATQRFVYKEDTFENLCEEWKVLEAQLNEESPRLQHHQGPGHRGGNNGSGHLHVPALSQGG